MRPWLLDQRNALRVGFGVVLALGLFSTFEAARIQRGLSAATADIYRQHLQQDEVRFELRRTLWMATTAVRDYLLNPSPNRDKEFRDEISPLRSHAYEWIGRLDRIPETEELRNKFDEFWETVAGVSQSTDDMTPTQRYEFARRQVGMRRSALGQLLREWDAMGKTVLRESEERFENSRRFAADRLFWILGLSFLSAAAVSLFSLRYWEGLEARASAQHREVVAAKDELARLSSRLMEVQEQERAAIARDLHDEIGQGLATLRLEVARAESLPERKLPEIRERLGRARVMSDSIVQTVRQMCMLLRPSMLDDLGLIPAIQWLAQDFQRRTNVTCRFTSEGVKDTLPEALRTCIYRVVQESLHNCEKHADATCVEIELRQTDQELQAVIVDNGNGFHPENARAGRYFGLVGMRERALGAGGSLTIESAPGKGAKLELRVPLLIPSPASKTILETVEA